MSEKTGAENIPESEFEHAKELARSLRPGKNVEAIRILERLGGQGHAEACFMLGCLAENRSWCYSIPADNEKDLDLGAYWFTKAFELFKPEAENGNLHSQVRLAEMYECGCGTKRDHEKAVYWQRIVFEQYLASAEAGDTEKQHLVAELYQNGILTEKNPEKAAFWENRYAEHADADKLYSLAMDYIPQKSDTSGNSYRKAETLLLKAAETADAELLYNIGRAFLTSPIHNPDLGYMQLQKAAEMGHPDAKVDLADMYLIQHETTPGICRMNDCLGDPEVKKMCKYTRASIKLAHLGNYYRDRSEYYLELANDGYNFDAAFRLALRMLTWNPRNPTEEAISILEEVAAAPNFSQGLAGLILGCLCYRGFGMKKDDESAAKWFIKAAEHNYCNAQLIAGVFYLNGIGVEKNPEQAAYWLKKVAGTNDAMNSGYYLSGEQFLPSINGEIEDWKLKEVCTSVILSLPEFVEMALPWFIQEAENGNPGAQLGVGIKFLQERSFIKENSKEKQGIEYIRKAAEQNYAPAQYEYGCECLRTEKEKAIVYLKKAAENGWKPAQRLLERLGNEELDQTNKRTRQFTRPLQFTLHRGVDNIEGNEFHIPSKYLIESLSGNTP